MSNMIEIQAPGSKSITHRAIIMASLANNSCVLNNCLFCDDTNSTINALSALGAEFEKNGHSLVVKKPICRQDSVVNINCMESGSTFRFIIPLATFLDVEATIDGGKRLRQRPILPLVFALEQIGAKFLTDNGYAPVQIHRSKLSGNVISIDASKSSQFISALLLSAPLRKNDLLIFPAGKANSMSYTFLTCKVMRDFGYDVQHKNGCYIYRSTQTTSPANYNIEGDYSSAAFILAASMITRKPALIRNLKQDSSQGDKAIITLLTKMGARIIWEQENLVCYPGDKIHPIDADLADTPDLAPILAVLSAFAEGNSNLSGIQNLKYKESDRIQTIVDNLQRCAINARQEGQRISIEGGILSPGKIYTAHDHRISMSFQVAGLLEKGVVADDEKCVSKSYPQFEKDLLLFRSGAGDGPVANH